MQYQVEAHGRQRQALHCIQKALDETVCKNNLSETQETLTYLGKFQKERVFFCGGGGGVCLF